MKIWGQNSSPSDYSDAVWATHTRVWSVWDSDLLHSKKKKKKKKTLWTLHRSPSSSCSPVVQSAERRGARWAGCGDVKVCPCGRGSCVSLKCRYNVATGGQLITRDHNEIKRCCYILWAYCNTTGLHKHHNTGQQVNICSSPEKN